MKQLSLMSAIIITLILVLGLSTTAADELPIIEVSPLELDFGEVELDTSRTVTHETNIMVNIILNYKPSSKKVLFFGANPELTYADTDRTTILNPAGYFVDTASGSDATLLGDPDLRIKQTSCLTVELYGEESEEVALLRNFRDSLLNKTSKGREIIKQYYEWSPKLVKAMKEDEKFREEMKEMIDLILPLLRQEVE